MAIDNIYFLAFDHGTSGLKTSIVDLQGKVIDSAFKETPIYYLEGGGAEQDPEDWWDAMRSTAMALIQNNPVPAKKIKAVCVSSTFSSTVAVDRNGNHLMNCLTWMDSRGAPHVHSKVKGFPTIQGINLFKALRWVNRTAGAPSLSGKDDIGHMLWIQHELPAIYSQTHCFLPSKDYLNLKLTGKMAASYDSIQLFWVTDIRDCHRIRYDKRLIRWLGVDRQKLPPLKWSTDVLGTLLPEVADEIGLPRETPVMMGSPDHQCACLGSGAVRDYEGHLYVGTSSWIECLMPHKKTDIRHSIASFPTAVAGKYQCVNEQDIAGGCLPFLVNNILFQQTGLLNQEPPANIYHLLNDIAGRVPAGSHQLLFAPWLNGERTPVDDTTLRGGLFNVSKTTTRDHIIRAVMEGVAYNTRWSLQYIEKYIKRPMPEINIIGGGAQSDTWCQIFADILNRTIRKVKDPIHANARGAAFIAAIGLGYMTLADIPLRIQYEQQFRPLKCNRRTYDTLFKEFLKIHQFSRKLGQRLNRGVSGVVVCNF